MYAVCMTSNSKSEIDKFKLFQIFFRGKKLAKRRRRKAPEEVIAAGPVCLWRRNQDEPRQEASDRSMRCLLLS